MYSNDGIKGLGSWGLDGAAIGLLPQEQEKFIEEGPPQGVFGRKNDAPAGMSVLSLQELAEKAWRRVD